MKKRTSVSTKVHVPLISVLVIGLIIILAVAIVGLSGIEKEVHDKDAQSTLRYVNQIIKEKRSVSLSNAVALSENANIKEALINNDRSLALREVQSIMKAYQKAGFENVKIHLHSKGGSSFLRSWNDKEYGDNLAGFRESIRYILQHKKAISAIEVGKNGISIRGIAPIFDKFRYIGSIEFMSSFSSLVKSAKNDISASILVVLEPEVAKITNNSLKFKEFTIAQEPKYINNKYVADLEKNSDGFKDVISIGDSYITTKIPIKDFSGKRVGYIFAGKYTYLVNRAVKHAENSTIYQISIMLGIDLTVLILLIIIINRVVKAPLQKLTLITKDLASGDGDLTKRLDLNTNDEIGETSHYINQFIEKIQKIIKDTNSVLVDSKDASKKLSTGSADIKNIAGLQTKNVKVSQSITENVTSELDVSEELAINTSEDIISSNKVLHQMIKSIEKIIRDINKTSQKELKLAEDINSLNAQTLQIKDVLGIIKDIADQTNLLALNAAIEAARAGEHGRGFAVVAENVRGLAEKTQKSLNEIDSNISLVVENVQNVSQSMNENAESMQTLNSQTTDLVEIVNETKDRTEKTISISKKSSEETVVIGHSVKTLFDQMAETMKTTVQNEDIANELNSISKELSTSFKILEQKLGEFRV